jgi:DNA-binding beta-propeller fold protein YncE
MLGFLFLRGVSKMKKQSFIKNSNSLVLLTILAGLFFIISSCGGGGGGGPEHRSVTQIDGPVSIAIDTVNNEIFVGNNNNSSITVYGRTANGSVAPMRTISGASTGISGPWGMAVDTVNNEIFVSNYSANNWSGSITVYGRTASGNVAPTRSISGGNTGMSSPKSIALDTVNNEIFVANVLGINSITVYGRTDSGNVAPTRTISGGNTGILIPEGIAVDTVNNEIFVANYGNGSITVYGKQIPAMWLPQGPSPEQAQACTSQWA